MTCYSKNMSQIQIEINGNFHFFSQMWDGETFSNLCVKVNISQENIWRNQLLFRVHYFYLEYITSI